MKLFNLFMLFSYISLIYANPIDNKNLDPVKPNIKCCVDHKNKPTFPLEKANYNCENLTPYGSNRCNQVYGGNICRWISNKKCLQKSCKRLPHYEIHYGKLK